METSVSKYSILFRVKILHHYFLDIGKQSTGSISYELFDDLSAAKKNIQLKKYDIDNWLSVTPSTKTNKLIRDRGLIFKRFNDGFAVFTSLTGKNPAKNVDATNFDFDLAFRGEGASVSALPIIRSNENRPGYYLFSNEIADMNGNTGESLCQLPPAFDNTHKYTAGEIVAHSGSHYLALDKADNKNKSVTNGNYWKKIKKTIRFANASNIASRPEIAADANAMEILEAQEIMIPPFAFGRISVTESSTISNNFRVLNSSGEVQQKVFHIRINRL